MARWFLTFEDGLVSLGGTQVPGIFVKCSVRGQVTYDEAEQDGLSGKVKTPTGFDDADVRITLDLLSEDGTTCYEKLTELNALFTGLDSGGNPQVYAVVNSHLLARNINEVVFEGLRSVENDRNDIIRATLTFKEHRPATQLSEARVVKSSTSAGESGQYSSQTLAPTINTVKEPDAGSIAVDLEAP